MKNINYKNGFTLIELLAIIVILAIIAVIAVPKILNIIDGVKRDSIKSSARGYVDAVKKQIVVNGMDDTVDNDIREGTKTVEELGNIYGVKVDGEIPSGESTVTFVDGYIQSYSLYIGDYIVIMEDNVIYVNKLGFIDVASLTGLDDVIMKPGETKLLTVSVKPSYASNKNINYVSNDTNIVTVDNNGMITAVNSGNTTILVTSSNTLVSGSINVTVREGVSLVSIEPNELSLAVGGAFTLNATVTPDTVDNRDVKWTSNNDSIVTVDENTGMLLGISKGNAVITAISQEDNTKTGTINVSVIDPVCTLVSVNPKEAIYKVSYPEIDGVIYSTGDKYTCEPGNNFSSNFYVLSVNNTTKKVSLLAERNFPDDVTIMNWNDASQYLTNNNYSASPQSSALWNKVDSVTLPTGLQIATAGKVAFYANWKSSSNPSFFGVGDLASPSTTDMNHRKHLAWLYNYTNNCKSAYECQYSISGAHGYWTSTRNMSYYSGSSAWKVESGKFSDAGISNSDFYGVCPVITLSTSKIKNVN